MNGPTAEATVSDPSAGAAGSQIEEFSGSVDGRNGAFTLVHRGQMNAETQSLEIAVLQGSGSGELETITGSMLITQSSDGHSCDPRYEF